MGDSDTSLLLSLKHPQPSVRVSAVEHLMSIITNEQVWQEASLPVSSQSENDCCYSCATHTCPEQHRSLTDTFLKDAVTDRLKDDVPEVVSAALKVVEVSGDGGEYFPLQASCSIAYRLHLCHFSCCMMFWTLNTSCHVYWRCYTERNRQSSNGQ